jgi:hypothetical protein
MLSKIIEQFFEWFLFHFIVKVAPFVIAVFLWFYSPTLLAAIFLGCIAFKLWVHYAQQKFISGITWVLLEIVPPREVLRSPKAMELFFTNALFHHSNKGMMEEYWQGAVWFWFSLEIVSISGNVHFYIRTPSRLKDLVTTQIYAQYPQAQVRVAEDYTLAVDKISKDSAWNLWGCEFKLDKPDAYKIKTYIDFGLDKDPKEEFKVDPISPVIELFSSIKKDEQMWAQIVVRPAKKEYHTHGTAGTHDWVKEVELEVKKLLLPYSREQKKVEGKEGKTVKEFRVPKFLESQVKSMEEKVSKLGFDCGIRVCYVAKKEAFQDNSLRNIRLIWRQYSNPNSNSFGRYNGTQGDAYSWSSLMMSESKVNQLKDRMLNEYRERSFFYPFLRHHIFSDQKFMLPWPLSPLIFPNYRHSHTFVLNTEELATIFHFPGQILQVPTLERIESKEASPPTNLPG